MRNQQPTKSANKYSEPSQRHENSYSQFESTTVMEDQNKCKTKSRTNNKPSDSIYCDDGFTPILTTPAIPTAPIEQSVD
jgi:hypothetical protein